MKKLQRFPKTVFTLLFLLTAGFVNAQVQFSEDGLKYTVTTGTEVSVSSYTCPKGALEIPNEVTNLGTTYTVTSIGRAAFFRCNALTSVIIPNSVTSIGDYAFYKNKALTSIIIPNSVTSIQQGAFWDCSGLTSVTIPSSVNLIDRKAFKNCTGLTSFTVNWAAPLSIKPSVFNNVTLSAVTLYVPAGSLTAYNSANVWEDFFAITPLVTWTGAATTDSFWATVANWDSNVIPTANDNIVIPNVTNKPIIRSNTIALANNITIDASSSLTIRPRGSLTMGGNLIQNGTFNINSSATRSGSLIVNGAIAVGNITYKRDIPSTDWHSVSSPVAGETFENILANNNFATGTTNDGITNVGVGLYLNNTGPSWLYKNSASVGAIAPGLGLSIKFAAAGNLSFTGTVNTSAVTREISTGTRNNQNLIGNPYTANINSNTFTSHVDNTVLLSEETVWLWNGTAYEAYNAVNQIEIEPGQGFFVDAIANGNLTFDTANQSHQASSTFKRKTPIPSFELFLENDATIKSTKIFYAENTSKGFDNGYDSSIFSSIDNSFSVFSELISDNEGKKLGIQTLPNSNYENMVVPIGLKVESGKEITFSLTASNFPSDKKIFLEDRETNTFTRLDKANSNYKITLTKSLNGIGRFYMHTVNSALSINNTDLLLENINIYKHDNDTLRVTGLSQGNVSLKLFTLLGKQVVSSSFNSNGVKDVSLPKLATGIYLVQLKTDKGELNKKIVLE
jgi:hypothetical protein